mgnify:CR=1 FL=1
MNRVTDDIGIGAIGASRRFLQFGDPAVEGLGKLGPQEGVMPLLVLTGGIGLAVDQYR